MNIHRPQPDRSLEKENELFEMANLYPRDTGLPMTVWISPRGHARHDVRVKVCRKHGNRMDADDTASVSVRPSPTVMAGDLDLADLKAVSAWITLNAEALVEYWDGELSTLELGGRLKRV